MQTSGERRADLDRELDESLREFDEMMLNEQETVAARAEDRGDTLGSDDDPGSTGSGSTGSGSTGASPVVMAGGSQSQNRGLSGASGATTPPDVADGSDDDIVARQLREAAENEQDPELREKLWDEYRNYKSGGAKAAKKKDEKKAEASRTDAGDETSEADGQEDAGEASDPGESGP